jgi:hypothetical protein
MAISILAEYPGKVAAATADYPLGVARNVSAPGALDGTPWEQLLYRDIQGLLQGLLEQVPAGPVAPSGTPDTALTSQYIDSLKLIVQGLDVTTFANAELDTALRAAPDGLGGTQWIANVAEELATAELDTSLVLTPDGLGGVGFNTIPGTGITNVALSNKATAALASVAIDNPGTYLAWGMNTDALGDSDYSGFALVVNGAFVLQSSDSTSGIAVLENRFSLSGANLRYGVTIGGASCYIYALKVA